MKTQITGSYASSLLSWIPFILGMNIESLRNAIVDLRYDGIGNLVDEAIEAGLNPLEILESLREGLNIVGEKYQAGDFFLSQLVMATETMKNALVIIKPLISEEHTDESKGTVVIGSIEGDIHDFGKMIVSYLLKASGFNVIDMGIDVPAKRFVDEAELMNADVIGISALLSTTQPFSRIVVEELKIRGLRDKYKVILGGTGVIPEIAVGEYGVDAAVNDGVEGVKIIKRWIEEKGLNL